MWWKMEQGVILQRSLKKPEMFQASHPFSTLHSLPTLIPLRTCGWTSRQRLPPQMLRRQAEQAWNEIPIDKVNRLVEGMEGRRQALLKAQGKYTPH
jgi:hypothetical protein